MRQRRFDKQTQAQAVGFGPDGTLCRENPWDGESWITLWIATILTVAVLLTGAAHGQGVLPPTEGTAKTPKKDDKTVVLSKKDLAIANDYVDLLEQLEIVISDYEKYYASLPASMIDDIRAQIKTVREGIRLGTYARNADKLVGDIRNLQAQLDQGRAKAKSSKVADSLRTVIELKQKSDGLSEQELAKLKHELAKLDFEQSMLDVKMSELDATKEALDAQVKAFRLSKNFERELESIEILLSQDVLKSLQEVGAGAAEIQVYVLQSLAENLEPNRTIEVYVSADADTVQVIEAPEPPHVISIPALPIPPGVISVPQQIIYDSYGSSEILREEIDSLEVTSSLTQIFIDNPTGDITIKGWDRPQLWVSSKTRMSARTNAEATKYAENIDLNLFPAEGRVYVELVMPQLNDPKMIILGNDISVWIPRKNPVNCASSYGRVDIADISGDVTVKARGSQVQLANLSGTIRALNKAGAIVVTQSSGNIDLQNSRGAIEVANCTGDFQIQNEYASVDLGNSRGTASIRNSGEVRVLDHTGDVKIDNSNGNVVVRRLNGDIDAHNAHEQLTLDGIRGSTIAAIRYGTASITDANGPVTASSHFGTLIGKSLAGPITVNGHRSDIQLFLRGQTSGPSTITADNGNVSLSLSPRTNILLSASTSGGRIISNLPVGIAESGTTRSAQFAFGSGSNGFTVVGTDATINVTESK